MTATTPGPASAGTGSSSCAAGLFRFDSRSPIRFVGLFSLLVFGWGLFCILWPLRWNLVALWVAAELFGYIFWWRPQYTLLNAQPRPHRPRKHDAERAWQRTLRYFRESRDVDYQMYCSGWFLGAQFRDIKRGNAEEFLAYAFWYRTLEEMREEGLGHVPAAMVTELAETWGLGFTDGYTPGLKFMGHLWEPIKAQWRPLVFYLAIELVGWCAQQLLERWGFQANTHKGMDFFTLNIKSQSQAELSRPISASRSSSASSALSDSTVSMSSCSSPTPAAAAAAAVATAQPALAAAAEAVAPVSVAPPVTRSKSSPFAAAGVDWAAAQLAANGDMLAASITAASAVHSSMPAALAAPAARRNVFAAAAAAAAAAVASKVGSSASRGSKQRPPTKQQRQQPAHHQQQPQALNPWLSTHTSMMLRALPNPLEVALSGGLAGNVPLLFLHGVGGLPAYLEMLLQVMALGHPLIVVKFNAVSMRPSRVQTADEVVASVVGVLDKLGVQEACVVGHSYGTIIAGRLARLHRKRVHSLCLVDPVCFGMFMPHLLSCFLYTTPKWRGLHHLVDFIKKGAVYIAAHELHVCASFSRGFFWSDLNLWPEDLAPGSVVLLSGRDDLMNARQVQAMLIRAGHVKVHYNKELTHGEFLIKSEVKAAIMDEVRGLLARSGSAVVELARPVLQTTMTLARNALGASAAIRMHTGSSGTRYVEDHTNKLVRTFTGNLTSMLQTMTTGRPSFAKHHATMATIDSSGSSSGSGSSSVASSHHRLSNLGPGSTNSPIGSAAGAWPQQQPLRSTAATSVSAGGAAAAAGAAGLPQAFSLPLQRRLNFRHAVAHSALSRAAGAAGASDSLVEQQPSTQVTFAEDRGLSPGPAVQRQPAGYSHTSRPRRGVLLVRRRTSSREGRRSSGSGSVQPKVLGVEAAGVQVVPGEPGANEE